MYFLSSKKEALEKLQDVGMVQGWGVEFLTYVSDCIYRLMIKHGNGKSDKFYRGYCELDMGISQLAMFDCQEGR